MKVCFVKIKLSHVLLSLTCCWLCGCSFFIDAHRQKEKMLQQYDQGNFEKAEQIAEKNSHSKSRTKDQVMWNLEAGSLAFYRGEYQQCIQFMNRAEQLIFDFDERASLSLRDAASTTLMVTTNLNALPYRGYCRDRIMIPIFKAFSYLGLKDEEAFKVEVRKIREVQQQVLVDYEAFFEEKDKAFAESEKQYRENSHKTIPSLKEIRQGDASLQAAWNQSEKIAHQGYGDFLNPLGIFLSGLVYLREQDYENALIDFKRLYQALPQSNLIKRYYVSILKLARRKIPAELQAVAEFDFPLTKDGVYLFFANGKTAHFEGMGISFPISVSWPVCSYSVAPFQRLRVVADQKLSESTMLTDFDAILSQEYHQRLPLMATQIILSTLVKEVAAYATISTVDDHYRNLAFLMVWWLKESVNTADTRSWDTLPKQVQFVQIPMPKDRMIKVSPDGIGEQQIYFSENCRSAIIFVHAPTIGVIRYHLFELNSR